MREICFCVFAIFVFLFSFEFAVAHSSGASLERVVGDYFIDIGYEPVDITEGDRLILEFNINKEGKDGERALFDNVWVTIRGEETLLATGIGHADIGATTLLYVIPEDVEDLTIGARFERGSEVLANTEFTVPVAAQRRTFAPLPIVSSAGAFVLLAAIVSFMIFRRRNPHAPPR